MWRIRVVLIVGWCLALVPHLAADKAARIDSLLSRYHEYELFNGSVLGADGGKVIYKAGFGLANMEWDQPNAADTKFRLGSITKQFTAALVLQLVREGKVDLNAPLGRYVPEYPPKIADKVTVHHLLTHTSGIVSYTSLPNFRREISRDPYKPLKFLDIFADKKPDFEPGEKFRYSNSGYFLLGVIIEKVTGLSYEEALRERIFGPLGMASSGYDRHRTRLPKRATGYRTTLDGFENAEYLDMSLPYAAGSLYSTVEDLYTWDQALYTDKVILAKLRELMFTPHEKMGNPRCQRKMSYGYGWVIETATAPGGNGELTIIGHGGGINGFNTVIHRIPSERHLIVLLNNLEGASVLNPMTTGIRAILYGEEPKMPKQPVSAVLYETYQKQGARAAVRQYRQLRKNDPGGYELGWRQLERLGRHLVAKEKAQDAIEVFCLGTQSFPKQAGLREGLGDAHRAAGSEVLAIEAYARVKGMEPRRAKDIDRKLKELADK